MNPPPDCGLDADLAPVRSLVRKLVAWPIVAWPGVQVWLSSRAAGLALWVSVASRIVGGLHAQGYSPPPDSRLGIAATEEFEIEHVWFEARTLRCRRTLGGGPPGYQRTRVCNWVESVQR